MDKQDLRALLRAHIAADLEAVTQSQEASSVGAVHEESKAENDKDTRAIEASYLARGLAERVASLRRSLAQLDNLAVRAFGDDDAIGLSALVEVEDEEGELQHYFVAPAGAGIKLQASGLCARVVTPESPLGRALLGQRAGDELQLRGPRGTRTVVVCSVR